MQLIIESHNYRGWLKDFYLDSDSSESPGTPTQASSPVRPQVIDLVDVSADDVINISDQVPLPRQNISNHDDVYEGELSPVEIVEPVKPVFRPDPQPAPNLNETNSEDRLGLKEILA